MQMMFRLVLLAVLLVGCTGQTVTEKKVAVSLSTVGVAELLDRMEKSNQISNADEDRLINMLIDVNLLMKGEIATYDCGTLSNARCIDKILLEVEDKLREAEKND